MVAHRKVVAVEFPYLMRTVEKYRTIVSFQLETSRTFIFEF